MLTRIMYKLMHVRGGHNPMFHDFETWEFRGPIIESQDLPLIIKTIVIVDGPRGDAEMIEGWVVGFGLFPEGRARNESATPIVLASFSERISRYVGDNWHDKVHQFYSAFCAEQIVVTNGAVALALQLLNIGRGRITMAADFSWPKSN
jgi:hypothetical protein